MDASTFFERHGYVHIPSFYDVQQCNLVLAELKNFIKSFSADYSTLSNSDFETVDGEEKLKYCQSLFESNREIRKLLTFSLFSISAELLRVDNVYLSDIELHIRNSGGGEIPIHQDNVSFSLTNAKALTAYIVLVDQDKSTGGLGYYDSPTGSPLLPHQLTSIPGFSSSIASDHLQSKKITFPNLCIGDVVFHHCQTPHFARPRPGNLPDAFALSVRIFSSEDTIDESQYQLYLQRVSQHRS
jgi:hypothetical protein